MDEKYNKFYILIGKGDKDEKEKILMLIKV